MCGVIGLYVEIKHFGITIYELSNAFQIPLLSVVNVITLEQSRHQAFYESKVKL